MLEEIETLQKEKDVLENKVNRAKKEYFDLTHELDKIKLQIFTLKSKVEIETLKCAGISCIKAIQIKINDKIIIDDCECIVTEVKHAGSGKHGSQKAWVMGKNILTNTKKEKIYFGYELVQIIDNT